MASDFDSFIDSANDALSSIQDLIPPSELDDKWESIGLMHDALSDILAAVKELAEHSSVPRRADIP